MSWIKINHTHACKNTCMAAKMRGTPGLTTSQNTESKSVLYLETEGRSRRLRERETDRGERWVCPQWEPHVKQGGPQHSLGGMFRNPWFGIVLQFWSIGALIPIICMFSTLRFGPAGQLWDTDLPGVLRSYVHLTDSSGSGERGRWSR